MPNSTGSEVRKVKPQIIKSLRDLRVKYKKRREGYRLDRYNDLAEGYHLASLMKKRPEVYEKFKELKYWESKKKFPKNMATSVMMYVTDARGTSQRQMAWKYAVVIRYLHENEGAKTHTVAEKIVEMGGISAIYEMAKALNDSKKKVNKSVKDRGSRNAITSAIHDLAQDAQITSDEWDSEEPEGASKPEQTPTITVEMNAARYGRLMGMEIGASAKLVVTRLDDRLALFEAEKVTIVKG
ncbi:hypothetical protein V5G24_22060 [Xanthobacter sp. VTT E-85241]|uniref:hypothetical protein n=1 Tax=Roseixanthobacter finlandensis TaxID=3119922 RepID=UPI0037267725